jgi:hypothetical protein
MCNHEWDSAWWWMAHNVGARYQGACNAPIVGQHNVSHVVVEPHPIPINAAMFDATGTPHSHGGCGAMCGGVLMAANHVQWIGCLWVPTCLMQVLVVCVM